MPNFGYRMSTFFDLVSQNILIQLVVYILVPQRNVNVEMHDNFFCWLSHKVFPI